MHDLVNSQTPPSFTWKKKKHNNSPKNSKHSVTNYPTRRIAAGNPQPPSSPDPTTILCLCPFFFFFQKTPPKLEAHVFSPEITRKRLTFLKKLDSLLPSLHPIGKGGCGVVYRLRLPGGLQVAVKKIVHGDTTKKMRQIQSEIRAVAGIRHPNLLPLLAHLSRPDCHYLVYHYMNNGSLEDRLSATTTALDWPARYRIALGIAAGLEYLHTHAPRIIHRDLKPANVLLDDGLAARISDFGLAATVPDADTHVTTRNVAGTVAYIAPEYYQTFRFTERCDVYSFGVVLAALVTGKLPADEFFRCTDEVGLVQWMRGVVASGDPSRAIDPRLLIGSGPEAEGQMVRVLRVAWSCTEENPKQRPTSDVARVMLARIVDQ